MDIMSIIEKAVNVPGSTVHMGPVPPDKQTTNQSIADFDELQRSQSGAIRAMEYQNMLYSENFSHNHRK